MKCFCGSGSKPVIIEETLPLFTHLDYSTIGDRLEISQCPDCGYVANRNTDAFDQAFDRLLSSDSYSKSEQTTRKVVEKNGRRYFRAELQAKVLRDYLIDQECPRVLDIGCFDGLLLKALKQEVPSGSFYGYDSNAHLEAAFASNAFEYIRSPGDIGELDMAIFSHSLMYIRDIDRLLAILAHALRARGQLFFQISEPFANAANLLLGDQAHYFDWRSLSAMLRRFGYGLVRLENSDFGNEMLILAEKNKVDESGLSVGLPRSESSNMSMALAEVIRIREAIAKLPGGDWIVFGANVNAAFADALLGEKNLGFYDEYVDESGAILRGKAVCRPKAAESGVNILIPFGKRSKAFAGRLIEKYSLCSESIYCI